MSEKILRRKILCLVFIYLSVCLFVYLLTSLILFFLSKEQPEKTAKPLSFALRKPIARAKENKLKTIEVFKSIHEDCDSDPDEEMQESFDGYRPNKMEKKAGKKDQTMEEKAKETMEKAKMMIAEAQKKQRELQQGMYIDLI